MKTICSNIGLFNPYLKHILPTFNYSVPNNISIYLLGDKNSLYYQHKSTAMKNSLHCTAQRHQLILSKFDLTLKVQSLLFLVLSSTWIFGQSTTVDLPAGSTSWTVPCGVSKITIKAWGGGGGGGGSNSRYNDGSGGGGGAYVESELTVISGDGITYSVGQGGLAGAANTGGDGTGGGNTTILSISAKGGNGGGGNKRPSGVGGIATGGNVTNTDGSSGIVGTDKGGNGGSAPNGGNGGVGLGPGIIVRDGVAGGTPGGGGSGGHRGSAQNASGGNGGNGRITVTYTTIPAAPTVNTITMTSANLTWVGTGNYIVEYGLKGFIPGTAGTKGPNGTIATSTGTSPYNLEGLTFNTEYDVYIRQVCTSLYSPNSSLVNFKTLMSPCAGPASQPTVLNLTTISTNQINGAFTAASPAVSGYLVLRSKSPTLIGANPVDGAVYSAGNILGNATVVSSGVGLTFSSTDLSQDTLYYYFVMSYNNSSCSGGPKYRTAAPLSGDKRTLCGPPNKPTVTPKSASSAQVSWGDGEAYIIEYGPSGFTPGTGATAGTNGTIATGNVSPVVISGLSANTTYNVYRRKLCTSGGYTNSQVVAFKTLCSPTTAIPANTFIKDVRFLGTLNDVSNSSINGTNGYQDWTNLPNKARQAAGEGLNIFVENNGINSYFKAWVDWDKNGSFNNTGPVSSTSELVFTSGTTLAISTTFGIIIPAGIPPGDYTIRIRIYNVNNGNTGGSAYDSCSGFTGTQYGEAEDYTFTVVANCSANLTIINPSIDLCGSGTVTLSATANSGSTTLRWYDAETGGTRLAETPVDGSFTAFFTTPSINASTTYYVTSYNGTCESIVRTPIVARIKPIPNISFDLPLESANFCGDVNSLKLISSGGNELVEIFNEKFDSGLGIFGTPTKGSNDTTGDLPLNLTGKTQWQNKSSTYKPEGSIWSPAISSGFGSNQFAYATSDYSGKTVETIMTTTLDPSKPTTNFLNLTLSFSAYYSYYGDKDSPPLIKEGLFVEVSTDGGTNWTAAKTYKTSLGIGTRFENTTQTEVNLNSYIGINNLKIRFRYLAYWGDGVAIDNVKLSGVRPITAKFTWTAPNIVVYKADCETKYIDGTEINNICIKPTPEQLQAIETWNISAAILLSSGCTTTGVITVQNNNKFWDKDTTDWNTTQWQPNTAIPDITKCVIVKKPVILGGTTDGAARNVKVESGGSLQIMAPRTLTINEYLRNDAGQDKVLLESDANLIQQKSSSVNVGPLTAKRALTGLRNGPTYIDYVYWSSPVAGQLTKGSAPGAFSPGTPPSSFFSYRESNDQFYETADLEFIPGKGYAVEAEVGVSAKTYTFKGVPNNGNKSINIKRSANTMEGSPPVTYIHGYNLVGNPYPSNISFDKLFEGNSSLIYKTAWFWTNNKIYTPQQMGSQYEGNNYAIYNATGGNSAMYNVSTGSIYPTGFIKVGQAFIVQNKQQENTNDNLIFTNDMRVSDPGQFFSKGIAEKNRFWLTLTNPANVVNSQLIGYMDGASDGFEQDFDADSFGDYSDLFYSKLDDMKLVIQGRNQNFKTSDKVNLGAVISQNGIYTISLNEAEGIFGKTQKIYLKDKIAGVVTDLTTNDYSFTTTKGISEGRFEIIYQIDAVLGTDEGHKENIVVYREANTFGIKATQKILEVEMFDYAGRLLAKVQPLSTSSKIPSESLPNAIYVLQIKLENGDTITKKIRK